MTRKAVFYHAGCPICVDAERQFASETIRRRNRPSWPGERNRIAEAEAAGVKSVPAFVIDGHAYHINFGAALDALK